jgi:hypothetical protein
MPGSNAWAGLAAGLESLGQSTGRIARQYQDDVEEEDLRKLQEKERFKKDVKEARALGAKRTGTKKIQSAMQAMLNPMEPDEAAAHLADADPKAVTAATSTIKEVTAKAQAALPRQSKRWEENKIKRTILDTLGSQESDSTDIAAHPRAANGLQAFGKYGIVPELHIDKVGLDPKNPKDIEKWKADKDLQKLTAERIVDENYKASGGDVKETFRRHYGLTKDPNKKQALADGRSMPSSNEYVEQAYSKYKGLGGTDSIERTAGNARQAIDSLVSTDFQRPSKSRVKRDEATLGKLYMDMTSEEIEQNKEYLDRVTSLAGAGREDYRDEIAEYGANLNRQTTAAMNAMKLDEQTQIALAKIKSGVKSLTPEEVRALESRRKLLEGMRSQITDFTTRVGAAKPGAREAILKTRPDLSGVEEPGTYERLWGHLPFTEKAKGMPVIDDAKIQKKLDLIDSWMMETDRALAGLGGLERAGADEIESDENTMLSRPGGKSPLSKYLTPVNK